jgi:hypothetical protein
MSVFAGLFLTDGAELHQKSSQIMYHDNCLPIYLYYSFMLAGYNGATRYPYVMFMRDNF